MHTFLVWFIGWYMATSLGITIGYHRLLTHRSFRCPRWLEYFWATLGYLSLMGPPARWVSVHRYHHANADREKDPHSPVQGGWWWSQVGWISGRVRRKRLAQAGTAVEYEWAMSSPEAPQFLARWARDLYRDPYYRHLTFRLEFLVWGLTLALSLWLGGWMALLGRLVATGAVLWSTWLVNSSGHSEGVGYRTFETLDSSRNVWWVALLTNGEGWHNNHHHRPQSARHGMRWWELDLSWISIRVMQAVGLVTKVHTFKSLDADRFSERKAA